MSTNNTKYTKELLEKAVGESLSYAGVLRQLGLKMAGGTQTHIKNRIVYFKIDTSHFTGMGWSKGVPHPYQQRHVSDILVVLPDGSNRTRTKHLYRSMVFMGVLEKCSLCSIGLEWNGIRLVLEIDHIDGNWLNNRIENLRFLCPNCHSQQRSTNKSYKNK